MRRPPPAGCPARWPPWRTSTPGSGKRSSAPPASSQGHAGPAGGRRLPPRTRRAARRCVAHLILPTVATREYTSRNDYLHEPETAATRMTAQERTHARLLQALLRRASGAPGSELARIEGRHRTVGGNALRAAVLGANDGLCS